VWYKGFIPLLLLRRFAVVLPHTQSLVVHNAKIILSFCLAVLCRCTEFLKRNIEIALTQSLQTFIKARETRKSWDNQLVLYPCVQVGKMFGYNVLQN